MKVLIQSTLAAGEGSLGLSFASRVVRFNSFAEQIWAKVRALNAEKFDGKSVNLGDIGYEISLGSSSDALGIIRIFPAKNRESVFRSELHFTLAEDGFGKELFYQAARDAAAVAGGVEKLAHQKILEIEKSQRP